MGVDCWRRAWDPLLHEPQRWGSGERPATSPRHRVRKSRPPRRAGLGRKAELQAEAHDSSRNRVGLRSLTEFPSHPTLWA